jgi:polar amino acid transport system substrate-binding protein
MFTNHQFALRSRSLLSAQRSRRGFARSKSGGRCAGLVSLATVLLLPLTSACGSSGGGNAAAPPSGQHSGTKAPLFDALPDSVRKAGEINVGMELSTKPLAIYADDGHTPEGIDPDLAMAVGPLLGVKVNIQNIAFAQGIPAINTGRIDMYWTFTNDTPERRQQVDVVDFTQNGQAVLLPAADHKGIKSLDDLCGTTISIQSGSNNLDVANGQSEKCVGAGKSKVTVLQFDELPQALLQLKGGRADALMTSYAIAGYYAKSDSSYTLMPGPPIGLTPAGVTFKKGNTALEQALQQALQKLVDDGTYGKLFDKWGLSALQLKTITINGR